MPWLNLTNELGMLRREVNATLALHDLRISPL